MTWTYLLFFIVGFCLPHNLYRVSSLPSSKCCEFLILRHPSPHRRLLALVSDWFYHSYKNVKYVGVGAFFFCLALSTWLFYCQDIGIDGHFTVIFIESNKNENYFGLTKLNFSLSARLQVFQQQNNVQIKLFIFLNHFQVVISFEWMLVCTSSASCWTSHWSI